MAKLVRNATQTENISTGLKRTLFSQSEIPAYNIHDALKVARTLYDNFAGGPEAPHSVAISCDLSPTSSHWRMLSGAALAYGLTTGSYSAEKIAITPLGRRILAPTEEGDNGHAMIEACLKPRLLNLLFSKYDKSKFPRDEIAKNVLVELGVPRDRVDSYLQIVVGNGKACGIIQETRTGPFVALDVRAPRTAVPEPASRGDDVDEAPEVFATRISSAPGPVEAQENRHQATPTINNKVFVSHGKNKKVVGQLKEILSYGGFDPVVAAENETASKPVPEKVMTDMRACSFAVIHVSPEKELIDANGEKFVLVNQNVLIEIGASMALHRNRFVLLVEEGVALPSNLQGMYECRYKGDSLDFAATMKLLKAFNEFKSATQ